MNLREFSKETIAAVKEYVARQLQPIGKRLDELGEQIKAIPAGPKGEKGDKGDSIKGEKGDPGQPGESIRGDKGDPGKDVDIKAVSEMVQGVVAEHVAKLPAPKDGAHGLPGKDADMAALQARVDEMVKTAVSAIPVAKDGAAGKDVDYDIVRGIVSEAVSKTAAQIPAPKDGRDGRDGNHGRDAADLNPVLGIDIERSYPAGTWAEHANGLWRATSQTKGMEGWRCVVNGVAAIELEQKSTRSFSIKVRQTNGKETLQAFIVPTPLDAGIYQPEAKYVKGDGVTYGGSWWLAQIDDPTDKPGVSEQWRLAVRRGRDGKDGVVEAKPTPGKIKVGS